MCSRTLETYQKTPCRGSQGIISYYKVSYGRITWPWDLKALPRQDFLQSLMKAGYGNGHLCFSFSFSSQHRVCHLWAFDGLQDVIRLHSEAQMEWDANRRDSTNSQIWKNQCSQGTESFALFGPCSDVLRPGSKTELFWAAAGMQWNSGRAEEETGLPTKSAARLWVQWVSQCTSFPLSDLVIFWKTSSFSWGISLLRSQVCSSDSGSILAYLDVGGKRLVVGFRDHLLQWNSCLAGLRQMTVSWIFWTNSDVDGVW